jgi:hypothetical protein
MQPAPRRSPSSSAPRDAALVAALVSGATWEEAAASARCSRSTVARRMSDPEFRQALDVARREVLERTTTTLVANTAAAASVLAELSANPAVPASTRISAARSLLDLALRYWDAQLTDCRLAALEAALVTGDSP